MLELLRDHPGLKGAAIAKRLDVEEVTARRRLGTLVRYGWVTSSYAVGYHITEAGLDVLAGWDLQQERP